MKRLVKINQGILKIMLTSSTLMVGCSNYNGALQVGDEGVASRATKSAVTTSSDSSTPWVDVIDNTTTGGHSLVDANGNIIQPEPETSDSSMSSTSPSPTNTSPSPNTDSGSNSTPPVVVNPSPEVVTDSNPTGGSVSVPSEPVATIPTPSNVPSPTETGSISNPPGTETGTVSTPSTPVESNPVVTNPETGSTTPSDPVVSNPAPETSTPSAPVVSNPAPETSTPSTPVVSNPAPETSTPSAPVVSNPAPETSTPSAPVVSNPAPETSTPSAPVVSNPGTISTPGTETPVPESPIVSNPNPNAPIDACIPVAQNMCGSKAPAGSCDDNGEDNSTDNEDANECIAFKGLNLSKGILSRFMPHLKHNHKNVWLTDEPIVEPIRGHGKLIVIYTGQKGRGSIAKIDGWKGKLILCGFAVEQIQKTRGKVVLVNSTVKKLDYSRGRVVANFIESVGNAVKVKSSSISGGTVKAGVFSIASDTISSLGDWTKMSSQSLKIKSQLAEMQKTTLAEQENALKDLQQQLAEIEKSSKESHKQAAAKIKQNIAEIKEIIKDLLKLKISFSDSDDDHDCEQDTKKVYEIDLLEKWKEFIAKAKQKGNSCHANGKKVAEQVKSSISNLIGQLFHKK